MSGIDQLPLRPFAVTGTGVTNVLSRCRIPNVPKIAVFTVLEAEHQAFNARD